MTSRDVVVVHRLVPQLSKLYTTQKMERATIRDCGDFGIVGVVSRMLSAA